MLLNKIKVLETDAAEKIKKVTIDLNGFKEI